jgi:hypothetical protein
MLRFHELFDDRRMLATAVVARRKHPTVVAVEG